MPTFLTKSLTVLLTATTLLSTVSATVSLKSFRGKFDNLPSECESVYTTTIEGCQESDFRPKGITGIRCSESCVNGLVKIMKAVESSCQSANVDENSIIGIFLRGHGVSTLCKVTVVTIPPSPAATQAPARPTSTSSSREEEDEEETTSTTSEAAETTEAPSSSSTGDIAIDTTVPSTFVTSDPPSISRAPGSSPVPSSPASSAAAPTSSAQSQKSNADSGGGSPFDVVATGGSASLTALRRLGVGSVVCALAVSFAVL